MANPPYPGRREPRAATIDPDRRDARQGLAAPAEVARLFRASTEEIAALGQARRHSENDRGVVPRRAQA